VVAFSNGKPVTTFPENALAPTPYQLRIKDVQYIAGVSQLSSNKESEIGLETNTTMRHMKHATILGPGKPRVRIRFLTASGLPSSEPN
jgi:hypothetical protein